MRKYRVVDVDNNLKRGVCYVDGIISYVGVWSHKITVFDSYKTAADIFARVDNSTMVIEYIQQNDHQDGVISWAWTKLPSHNMHKLVYDLIYL